VTVLLNTRTDINLDAVCRAAWHGEDVEIGQAALERMADCRSAFEALLASDPDLVVYGVTSGAGDGASLRLSPEQRMNQARRPPGAGASFGTPMPERVVRAIVLARLANYLGGHAAVRPIVAQAVADMLDGRPLPQVPLQGNGGAGEVLALSHLFMHIGERIELREKEGMALINGSPCAAALVADAALAARHRLRLAVEVFALSIEAFRAPLEAYSAPLEELWGDEHETAALRALRTSLQGADPARRSYQAPVSYRIVPRVLGQAYRALDAAEKAAEISLRSVTDNPVFLPPDDEHPHGAVFSTGGYHNAQAYPALDGLAAAWTDLCLLAERHCDKIGAEVMAWARDGLVASLDQARRVGIFGMVQPAYWAEAQHAAQRTFLARGVAGQNDVLLPTSFAWSKERDAGTCLDAALAMLAGVASQTLYVTGREATPPLRDLLAAVRRDFPPIEEPRPLGLDAERLTATFNARIYEPAQRAWDR
jgi:histidine ammonia-lyase